MKSVLISIRPQGCEKITSGEKTIEVRKSAPKEVPFKCYIYESRNGGHRCKHCNEKDSCYSCAPKNVGCYNGRGRVIGEFICNRIDVFTPSEHGIIFRRFRALYETRLTVDEMRKYAKGKTLYGWNISDLKIYDKPKELREFRTPCVYAPTARCYPENCEMCPWNVVIRPPQNWMYVEDLGAKK